MNATVSTVDVQQATGLSYRQLDYAARQQCFEVSTRGTGDARRWTPLAVAQAALYAALAPTFVGPGAHSAFGDRVVFNACNAIGIAIGKADDVEIIRHHWIVIRDDTIAIVHEPRDFTADQTMTVMSLTPVADLVRRVFEQEGGA